MTAAPGHDPALAGRIAAYRSIREEVERAVLPLATSIDGRGFEIQASLHGLDIRRGGYVVLEDDDGSRLGQVTDLAVVSDTAAAHGLGDEVSSVTFQRARGRGLVLDGDGRPFHGARARVAGPAEVRSWLERTRSTRAVLTIGELLLAPGVPATLDSGGLNRHTFMCGQSGSGKTYSLGVLLERVLAETSLRVVILDPNSDYVGLGRLRAGADPALARAYAGAVDDIAVWSRLPDASRQLHLRFADLRPQVQAAILGLEPVRDREEYAVLSGLLRDQEAGRPLITDVDQLLTASIPGARQLGLRASNLGVLGWDLWSPRHPSLVEEVRHPRARCTVVDLGSLDTPQEQRVVAEAVLTALWEERHARQPCLVVIDEAHNVCPAEPTDELSRLSTDRVVQVAAEGRKYGLYLLTSTQRPHKVHEDVVSQCDNLLLMRMNSQADLTDLGAILSFVPPGLLEGATTFGMGQALVAGRFSPQAAYVAMGERVTEEGGADVATSWALPRS